MMLNRITFIVDQIFMVLSIPPTMLGPERAGEDKTQKRWRSENQLVQL